LIIYFFHFPVRRPPPKKEANRSPFNKGNYSYISVFLALSLDFPVGSRYCCWLSQPSPPVSSSSSGKKPRKDESLLFFPFKTFVFQAFDEGN